MAVKKLKEISDIISDIDICMMTTISKSGKLSARPMSNNGDVEYDGNSYYFTYEESQKVKDIGNNPNVELCFSSKNDLFIAISGKATLIRQRAAMEKHWMDSLNQWFEDGLDTEGLVLIHVQAATVKYWQNEEQGEINVD